MVNCPYCGKLTDPKLESCPHCGANIQKSSAPGPRAGRGRQTCPTCKAMVQEGDIICVVCGTNLLTGQKITEEAKAREKASRNLPLIIGGVALAAIILVALGSWIYVASRDPLNRAMELVANQEYLQAQDTLEAYVEQVPTDERALFELGKLQWRNNLFGPAASTFEQLVEINPANSRAALWAVVAIHESAGAAGRARQIPLLEQVVRAEPDNADAWYLLALARGTQGDVAGQVEALERVLSLGTLEAPAQQALGVALALNGDFSGAQRELARAEELTDSPDLTAMKGFVASMRGAEDDAATALRDAATSQQSTVRWEALTQLGKLTLEQGRYQDATRYLEEAMSLRKGNDLARYLHAVSLQASGYMQDALTGFEALTRERGEYAHEAAVQTADIYLQLDNVERAREAVAEAAGLGDPGAPFYTVRGRVLARSGDDAGARRAFSQALNADPAYAPAYLESGLLYVKSEQLAQGLRDLETYLELLGPDAQGREIQEIRELVNQLEQTTEETTEA